MWHWLDALIAWHRANVLGNVVASLEMAAVALLAGRPLLRRLRRHVAEQIQDHVGGLHSRLDDLMAHLTGAETPPEEGTPDGDRNQP